MIQALQPAGDHGRCQDVRPDQGRTDDGRLGDAAGRFTGCRIPDVLAAVGPTGGRDRAVRQFDDGEQSARIVGVFDADPPRQSLPTERSSTSPPALR